MNPSSITYHSSSKILEIAFQDGVSAQLSAEFLRVFSPSAEVRGHTPEQSVLQTGKKHVAIENLEAVGNYAIRIKFSDGHDTGIYSWVYLRELYDTRDEHWDRYLSDLKAANASRLPAIPIGHWSPSQS